MKNQAKNEWKKMLKIVIPKTSCSKIVFPWANFNENKQAHTTFYGLSENGHRKYLFNSNQSTS